MGLSPQERVSLIERYAKGPALLRSALAKFSPEAMKWRPAPGKWSAHEVVLHCGDSETVGVGRLRYLLGEEAPLLQGYDQDRWAEALDYHSLPLEPAFAAVEAVRANAVPLLRRLTEDQWGRAGRHTESGRYGVEDWLKTYAEHLEIHSRQIERVLEAWNRR